VGRGKGQRRAEDAAGRREALAAWAERGRLAWLVGRGAEIVLAAAERGEQESAWLAELEALVGGEVRDGGRGQRATAGVKSRKPRCRQRPVGDQERPRATPWRPDGQRLDGRRQLVLWVGAARVRGAWTSMVLTVDEEGRKQVAGLWSGSTADAAFSRALVGHLVEKGLSARDGLLAVHDGGPGLDGALRAAWGEQVLVGHCRQQVCVEVLAHLPEKRRPGFRESWRRLWTGGVTDATAGLAALGRDLEREHPGAAARLQRSREALLAVARLGLPTKLTARLGSVSAVRRLLVEASAGQVGAGAAAVAAGLSERLRHQRRLVGYEALPQLAERLVLHARRKENGAAHG